MLPSALNCRVDSRIAARPPSIAPSGPLGSPPSRSTPSQRQIRAPLGGAFNPAPAVLGTLVCSKTLTDAKTPDCRSANAVINPPIPPPTMIARIPSSFERADVPLDGGNKGRLYRRRETSPGGSGNEAASKGDLTVP